MTILTLKTICGTIYEVGIGVKTIDYYQGVYRISLDGGRIAEVSASKVEYVEKQ